MLLGARDNDGRGDGRIGGKYDSAIFCLAAIAGMPMRRMMGFMVITFVVALVTFGLSILFLLPGS